MGLWVLYIKFVVKNMEKITFVPIIIVSAN